MVAYRLVWCCCGFASLFRGRPVEAMQVHASQRGEIAQTFGGTTVVVDYSRPVAHGRSLFGNLIRWGDMWTPGANWATTFEVDKDVRLDNVILPKGKYSVWLVPRKESTWTFVLSRMHRVLHMWPPLSDQDQLRLEVVPQVGPYLEVLTWSFPALVRDGTTLRMQWGATFVEIHVRVELSTPVTITAEERAAYIGLWRIAGQQRGDTMDHQISVFYSDGELRLKGYSPIDKVDPEVILTPIGGNQLHPFYYRNGLPVSLETLVTLKFHWEGERADSFEVQDAVGRPIARGVRILHPE